MAARQSQPRLFRSDVAETTDRKQKRHALRRAFSFVLVPELFGGFGADHAGHAVEARGNDGFGFRHHARHQFLASRDVMDEALHHAGRPDAVVRIAFFIDNLATGTSNQMTDVVNCCSTLLFDGNHFLAHIIARDASSVDG